VQEEEALMSGLVFAGMAEPMRRQPPLDSVDELAS